MTKAFSALVMDILGRNIPLETAYKRYVSARDPNLGMERNSKRKICNPMKRLAFNSAIEENQKAANIIFEGMGAMKISK